jgi:lysophospholipase L1-like esterase
MDRGDTLEAPGTDDVVRRAAAKLAALDAHVRARGAIHLIYLSPYLSNLNDGTAPDARVRARLAESGVTVMRIQDRTQLRALDSATRARLFHDGVHLSAFGHQVWSDIIRADLDSALTAAAARTAPR